MEKVAAKSIGHISHLVINITEPLSMNFDHIEMNSLNLYTGKNGTGKTFVLVNVFVLSYIMSAIVHAKLKGPQLNELAQFTFDKSFDNQNIDGIVGADWVSGAFLRVTLLGGKIHSVVYSGLEEITAAPPATFMSAPMRTFNAIQMYLKLRKVYNIDGNHDALMIKLLNDFKLYDVMYLEGLIHKLPKNIPDNILKTFKESYDVKDDLRTFEVDLEKCDFFVTIGDEKQPKYMSTYGSGHQALFNMFLGQI